MRIAILGTRGIPARYGGFETFAERLALGLTRRGISVTVFCESGDVPVPSSWRGIELRECSKLSAGPLQTILYDLECLWKARKDFDVVYMLGYGAAPFCILPRIWGTKVWINPDGLEWARAKWGFWARCYFKLMEWTSVRVPNLVVADADAVAAVLARRHGKLRDCRVIRYGCDTVQAPPPPTPLSEWNLSSQSYYLVVCRLEPENHVWEILEAFHRSQSSRQLIVIGNHRTGTAYVKKLSSIQDPRIRMVGTVYDREQLISLRYHAHAYLHGHSVGGTNPSLLEAMGCGNFIVAHDNPFNRETVGEHALFFRDSESLTEILDRVEAGSIERISEMRSNSLHRAQELFSWPLITEQYYELLKECSTRK